MAVRSDGSAQAPALLSARSRGWFGTRRPSALVETRGPRHLRVPATVVRPVHTDLVSRPAREPVFRYVLWFAVGVVAGWALGVLPAVGDAPVSWRMLLVGVLAAGLARLFRPVPPRRLCPHCTDGSHRLHRRVLGTCSVRYCVCPATPERETDTDTRNPSTVID